MWATNSRKRDRRKKKREPEGTLFFRRLVAAHPVIPWWAVPQQSPTPFRRHIIEDPEVFRRAVDEVCHKSWRHEMEGAGLGQVMVQIFEEDRPGGCFEGQAKLDPAAQCPIIKSVPFSNTDLGRRNVAGGSPSSLKSGLGAGDVILAILSLLQSAGHGILPGPLSP